MSQSKQELFDALLREKDEIVNRTITFENDLVKVVYELTFLVTDDGYEADDFIKEIHYEHSFMKLVDHDSGFFRDFVYNHLWNERCSIVNSLTTFDKKVRQVYDEGKIKENHFHYLMGYGVAGYIC
jgi:hypothetical protein